jgi:deoxyribodipyrimidine photo-lyase
VPTPPIRIRALNDQPVRADRAFVLYWMTSFRRLSSNFALQRAVEVAREIGRPLVILEALRCDYRWASDRLHQFVIEGMAEHARALRNGPVRYYPYLEPTMGAGRGLLDALARHAAVVVTDDYPCFFIPHMLARVTEGLAARLEAVDSNGLLPMRGQPRTFLTARSFRAHLQRAVPALLGDWPAPIDVADLPAWSESRLPDDVLRRWPAAPLSELERAGRLCASLPIDHAMTPAPVRGGHRAARGALDRFIGDRLAAYAEARNHPDDHGTSELSPWLHFGHLSAHEVFESVMTSERWTSRKLARSGGGKREGWWGTSAGAEAFLDQLVTWRELGFNMCATRPEDYASIDSLPAWALATLRSHAGDPRPYRYTLGTLEQAETHDEVWNAAQRQLVREGWMHGYLRMLWSKKILEWAREPREALDTMIALMDKHALDGRDPNSYAGYCWTLGRYDRPWGPERPIFGTVRYMSSANTVKKLRMRKYLAAYGRATC